MSVWVACTEEVTLTLSVYDGFGQQAGTLDTDDLVPSTGGSAKTFQFGNKVWIGVVTMKALVPFEQDEIYSYDLEFEKGDGSKHDLRSEGLLDDNDVNGRRQLPIGYSRDTLPTFVRPSEDPEKLTIAQASCRKIHGHGFDALAKLDEKIDKDGGFSNPAKRPQQLFLTGDQVYADDVPVVVLHHIDMLDGVNIGFNEKVQFDGSDNESEIEPSVWAPGLRQGLIYNVARMTSGSASSHVLSFSEYVRLYLMYWSNRAWNKPLYDVIKSLKGDNSKSKLIEAARDIVKPMISVSNDGQSLHWKYHRTHMAHTELMRLGLTARQKTQHIGVNVEESFDVTGDVPKPTKDDSADQHYKYFLKSLFNKVKRELKDIVKFQESLPNVSRLLANVPSYMIFDDHEVTDDWYLSQRWKNNVLHKKLGVDIVRNGLAAYAVFQDWGNVPDEYQPKAPDNGDADPKPKRTELIDLIIDYCAALKNRPERPAEADQIETLLGVDDGVESEVKWHYTVNSGPTRTFVLDTRTRREFESLDSPPGLLSSDALSEQLPLPHVAGPVPPFTIVVSAAPAPGLQSMEQLVQPVAAAAIGLKKRVTSGEDANDLEEDDAGPAHGFAGADYEAWGFNVKAHEALLARLSKYKSVLLFCGDVHYAFSSVLDYWKGSSTTPAARILTFTSSSSKNEFPVPWDLINMTFTQRLLASIGDPMEKVGWKDRVLSITGPASISNRIRLRQNPGVVPVAGWIAGSTVNRTPDFRWRLRVIVDNEPREGDPISSDIDLDDPDSVRSGYEKVTLRHRDSFIKGVNRRITFRSNIGLLSFEKDGATIKAVHKFLFVAGSRDFTNKKASTHVTHKAAVSTPDDESTRPELP